MQEAKPSSIDFNTVTEAIYILFMFRSSLLLMLILSCFHYSCTPSVSGAAGTEVGTDTLKPEPVELLRNEAEHKVDVLVGGNLFTSYLYLEKLKKPVLYPIYSSEGNLVTRGFPLANRAGERTDHPHHVGLWLNYGDVNGLDFWNNSEAIEEDKKGRYGSIVHRDIVVIKGGQGEGELVVTADWIDSQGKVLLNEKTQYLFRGEGAMRSIDRITHLTAVHRVDLKDNKEGMLGIRVSRELEHPSDQPEKYTDSLGQTIDVPWVNKKGVSGLYYGSNGIRGESVWGTRAEWMALNGMIDGESVTIVIFDHPENIGFPTYWHARGYGLFAANPLGQKALSNGRDELNFSLQAGETVVFKHKIVIYSGEVKEDQLHQQFRAFSVQ